VGLANDGELELRGHDGCVCLLGLMMFYGCTTKDTVGTIQRYLLLATRFST
jgi:hypothetical protein